MELQLNEVITFLVRQQFAREGDVITDSTKSQEVHIKGSSRVINRFIKILTENLPDFIAGNYEQYLKKICNYSQLNEADEIFQAFSAKIGILEPEDMIPPLILTSLMGEFLGKIREKAFKQTLAEIKRRTKVQLKITDENDFEIERTIDEKIRDLFQRNESNISLLYNLCFLEYLAILANSPKVQRTARILLGKYMNQVVEKLSQIYSLSSSSKTSSSKS